MRRCLSTVVSAVVMGLSAPALAQDANCPPGAWFCEDTPVEAPPTAAPAQPPAEQPAEAPKQNTKPPPANGRGTVVIPPPAGRGAPPPVVVYQPVPNAPPPQVIIVSPGAPRPRVVYPVPPPPPRRPPWRPEWGLNLRLEGVAMAHEGAAEDAGMGGIGIGLRYRPVPAFAIEGDVDLIGGTDYNGFERAEVPVAVNGLLFVNPRSRVQFYFIGGFHVAWAKVRSDQPSPLLTRNGEDMGFGDYEQEYSYFGGQMGIGLEFRLSRRVALDIDLLGFIRGRTDDGDLPEFVDYNTGRTTNSSGGGLFRGGVSFYW
jgi:hypothetical protein